MMGGRGIGGLDTGRERRWPRRKILVIIGGVWGGGGGATARHNFIPTALPPPY